MQIHYKHYMYHIKIKIVQKNVAKIIEGYIILE